jgi:hypothetical protein
MKSIAQYQAHSAEVEMRLLIDGESLGVGQLGPDFVLLDEVVAHPPCDAVIEMRIDEEESRWPVRLPEGITSERVPLGLR